MEDQLKISIGMTDGVTVCKEGNKTLLEQPPLSTVPETTDDDPYDHPYDASSPMVWALHPRCDQFSYRHARVLAVLTEHRGLESWYRYLSWNKFDAFEHLQELQIPPVALILTCRAVIPNSLHLAATSWAANMAA